MDGEKKTYGCKNDTIVSTFMDIRLGGISESQKKPYIYIYILNNTIYNIHSRFSDPRKSSPVDTLGGSEK